jgi:hypothetical protein
LTDSKTISTYLFKLLEKVVVVYHSLEFLEDLYDMFGFIGKFKTEVYAGFESVKQRLVTLEARMDAVYTHLETTAKTDATTVAADAKADVTADAAAVVAAPATAVADVANDVASTVAADVTKAL